ncbi:MAG: peptidylprolyl isomerase [Syntrophobacteria bacterium]
MAQPTVGDTVRVHYNLRTKDGTQLDASTEGEAFEFTVGGEDVLPGFTNIVLEMEEGETKKVSIPPRNAYGEYREGLVSVVERSQVPSHIEPQVGKMLRIGLSSGETAVVTVTDMTETTITIDANHPLAGKELVFELELLEIL